MEILDFQLQHPFLFHWNGKFLAPDENWVHLTRNLGDFELVVMTEGTLYIGEGDQEYVVQKGEYRIICPTPYQHGTHPSFCSFFWIHFAYNEEKNDPLRYTADTFHPVGEDEARILLPVDLCQYFRHKKLNISLSA